MVLLEPNDTTYFDIELLSALLNALLLDEARDGSLSSLLR
jgi:hypothetical protein